MKLTSIHFFAYALLIGGYMSAPVALAHPGHDHSTVTNSVTVSANTGGNVAGEGETITTGTQSVTSSVTTVVGSTTIEDTRIHVSSSDDEVLTVVFESHTTGTTTASSTIISTSSPKASPPKRINTESATGSVAVAAALEADTTSTSKPTPTLWVRTTTLVTSIRLYIAGFFTW